MRKPVNKFSDQLQKRSKLWLAAIVASTCTTLSSGCSRTYHRTRADVETGTLIAQKVNVATLPTIRSVQVDRASRMFDPFNPDRPPMPEDDPTAQRYMQIVDGKKHYPLWMINGRTNLAESPDWYQYLPLDERGVLVLDIEQSVRIALLNSTDYQQNLETLFLSALDVSSERFLLDNQYFAGSAIDLTTTGPGRRGNGGESRTFLTTSSFSRMGGNRGVGVQRAFSTGATFVAGLANSLTWQLSGRDTQTANTVLDFSLFQPLLRGAGRDVILERLTLAERTLLANVRAYERFRVGFAISVTNGRTSEPGPNRRGGLFGGAGLQGFTGLGGGFGTVGNNSSLGGGGGAGATVPSAGGYLGLLQDQLEIRNTLENTARLRDVLLQFEDQLTEQLATIPATQQTIPQQQLQVAQARQALLSAETRLLNLQTQYELSLDLFKRTMGLPSYICIEIRDPLLAQFDIVSTGLLDRRNEVATLREQVGLNNTQLLQMSAVVNNENELSTYRVLAIDEEVEGVLQQLYGKAESIGLLLDGILEQDLPEIRGDIKKLQSSVETRRKQLARLRQILDQEGDAICSILPAKGLEAALFEEGELLKLPGILNVEVERIDQRLKSYASGYEDLLVNIKALTQKGPPPLEMPDKRLPEKNSAKDQFERIRDDAILASQEILAAISDDVLALQVLQARARTESIVLPEIDITPLEAVNIARYNRLDWFNNRSALVDRWRAIEVVADQLEGFLDLTFSGDIQNANDNPLSFRNNTGRLQVGLQWDSPLTRLQERNQYRQVLIEYQQAKRSFYGFEDSVWLTLRNELRSIRLNQFNFELQRYAVRIAAEQITLNGDIRQISEALQQSLGPTAARDSIQALQALLDAQNTLIGVYVNYEAQRRNLNQDLGTARVDGEGLWVDPGPITSGTLNGNMFDGSMIGGTPFDIKPNDVLPQAPQGSEMIEALPTRQPPDVTVAPDAPGSPANGPFQAAPVQPVAPMPVE